MTMDISDEHITKWNSPQEIKLVDQDLSDILLAKLVRLKVMQHSTQMLNLNVKKRSLFINKEHEFPRVSPNFLVSCDCLGTGRSEVKCPIVIEDGNFRNFVQQSWTPKKEGRRQGNQYRNKQRELKLGRIRSLTKQTTIKEKRLPLNDEGTQVSNISFTSTSEDLGITTEEIDMSYGERELGRYEKCCQTRVKSFGEMSTQTKGLAHTHKLKFYDASSQSDKFYYLLSTNKKVTDFDQEYFRNRDDKVLFCTSLPSYEILNFEFELVSPFASCCSQTLSPFQEFVMVLIKLRWDVPFRDLAYRLNISVPTVSRIFHFWLITMDIKLSPFIHWPDHGSLIRSMPQCFQFSFGTTTTVIIDCFEIFIEIPTNLFAKAQTFSYYKHHNTIKVLIGITPQGSISVVFEAWGGRTSDKFF